MARPSDRLHDRARIHVQGGTGGDGAMSFRREAHVPRGGPDGGDGGRGGDVVVVCDDSLRDLQRFTRTLTYHAARGGHGGGAVRHGARSASWSWPTYRGSSRARARAPASATIFSPTSSARVCSHTCSTSARLWPPAPSPAQLQTTRRSSASCRRMIPALRSCRACSCSPRWI